MRHRYIQRETGGSRASLTFSELGRVIGILRKGGKFLLTMRDYGIGDMLAATPVLALLKRLYTNSKFTVAISDGYLDGIVKEILQDHPAVEQVILASETVHDVYDLRVDLSLRMDNTFNVADWIASKLQLKPVDYQPVYTVTAKERTWARQQLGDSAGRIRVAVATESSAGTRSIEMTSEFLNLLRRLDQHVELININRETVLEYGKDMTGLGLRDAAAILAECQFLITPDTCWLYFAQALGIRAGIRFRLVNEAQICKHYADYVAIHSEDDYGHIEEDIMREVSRSQAHQVDAMTDSQVSTIGIMTVWCPQGLGYVAQTLRSLLRAAGHQVKVFSYKLNLAAKDVRTGEWDIGQDLHRSQHGRDQLPVKEVLEWVERENINRVIILEPVKSRTWDIARALKAAGVSIYGLPMVEITRGSELPDHRIFDSVLCPTRISERILKERGLLNVKFIGWGIKDTGYEERRRQRGEAVRFYHNAGWGGDRLRKNTLKVVQAYHVLRRRPGIRTVELHVHTQRPLADYPPDLQEILKHETIKVTQGNLTNDEILEHNRQADIMVMPSKFEGLGLTLLEAMRAGKPVVTCDAMSMAEIVTDGETGALVPVESFPMPNNPEPLVEAVDVDVDDLAAAMYRVLRAFKAMGRQARARYEQHYNLDQLQERLTSVFNTQPSILFVAKHYWPRQGGAELSTHLLMSYLARHGQRCTAVCFYGSSHQGKAPAQFQQRDSFIKDGVLIIQDERDMETGIQAAINRVKPDLIITQLTDARKAVTIARARGIKCVLYVRSYAEAFCRSYRRDCDQDSLATCRTLSHRCPAAGQVRINSETARWATEIVTNSQFSARLCRRFYGKGQDYHVFYPPIDMSQYQPATIEGTYILMAKLDRDKGADIFYKLVEALPGEQFAVTGTVSNAVKQQLATYQNVTYLGHQEDMAAVYRGARLVIMPHLCLEAFGRVAIEAQACGVPVIGSHRGGIPEAIGKAGLVVRDHQNAEAWIQAVKDLLQDPERRQAYREEGLKRAPDFSIEVQGAIWHQFINDLLDKPFRILVVCSNASKEGKTERYIKDAINRLPGCAADSFDFETYHTRGMDLDEINHEMVTKVESSRADLVLFIGKSWLQDKSVRDIKKLKVLWYFDALFDNGITRLGRLIDYTFLTAGGRINRYNQLGTRSHHLMQGVDPQYHQRTDQTDPRYECDVAFIGTPYRNRLTFMDQLLDSGIRLKVFGHPRSSGNLGQSDCAWSQLKDPAVYQQRYIWEQDFSVLCNTAPIILGKELVNDLADWFSVRVFLTLGCGGFLITEYTPGMERYFNNGEHLVWYHSDAECLDLIQHYLQRPGERERIRTAGHRWVHERYGYEARIKEMLRVIRTDQPVSIPQATTPASKQRVELSIEGLKKVILSVQGGRLIVEAV